MSMGSGKGHACKKIKECFSCFVSESKIEEWRTKNLVTVSGVETDVVIEACEEDEVVCDNTEADDFFYMYETVFRELHVKLPFTEFERNVLSNLNCAPVQLGPNAWAFLRAYEIICNVLNMKPSVGVFFSFHEAKVREKGSWLYIGTQNKKGFLQPYASNYKSYKGKFFRVKANTESQQLIVSQDGDKLFPVSWQEKPFLIASFKREALMEEELADFLLLEKLSPMSCKKFIENETNPKALWNTLSEMAMTNAQVRALLKEKKGTKPESGMEDKKVEETSKSPGQGIVGRKRVGEDLKQTTLNFGKLTAGKCDAKKKRENIKDGDEDDVVEIVQSKGEDRWFIHMKAMEMEMRGEVALRKRQSMEMEELRKKNKELDLKVKKFAGLEGEVTKLKKVNKDLDEKLMKLAKEKEEAISNEDIQRGFASSLRMEMEVKEKQINELQSEYVNRYDMGFELAVEQVKVLHPSIDLSEVSIFKEIVEGKLVEPVDMVLENASKEAINDDMVLGEETVSGGNDEDETDKEKTPIEKAIA